MGFSVEGALNQYVLRLEEPRAPDEWWHPSSIFGCARKALYERLGTEKSNPHDTRASRVFRMGHVVHGLVQTAIAEDPLVVAFYPEIAIESEHLGIKGHSDGLIAYAGDEASASQLRAGILLDGWKPWFDDEDLISWNVLELKSINSNSFSNSFKYGDLPKEDHADQDFAYMKVLREEGGLAEDGTVIPPLGDKLRQGRVAYVSKDDMLIGEFVVLWSDAKDERLMARLALLDQHFADGTLPDRLPFVAGPKSSPKPRRDYRCSYCPFKDLCWDTSPDITIPESTGGQ